MRRAPAKVRWLAVATLLTAAMIVVSAFETAFPQTAQADNLWLQACSFYNAPGTVLSWSTNGGTTAWTGNDACRAGGSLEIDTTKSTLDGRYAQWSTTSPAGIWIDSAWTPPCSGGCSTPYQGALIACHLGSNGYQAYFQWATGGAGDSQRIANNDGNGCPYNSSSLADGTPINRSFAGTNFFGWYVACLTGSSCGPLGPTLGVRGLQLGATEYGAPAISPTGQHNLVSVNGYWIRGGGWPLGFQASDPSGVCNMRAWLNGMLIPGPSTGLDRAVWDQCDPSGGIQQWGGPVDTASFANGSALQLAYQADNAAGNWTTTQTATTHVDNSPVELTLSGRTDAPVTAGPQYVMATAAAGPSGVGSIVCSVDGSSWIPQQVSGAGNTSAVAKIPVSGLGSKEVSCYAANRAVDVSGAPSMSPTRSWSIRIGEPVVAGISFSKLISHCRRVRRLIKIPGRWVTARVGHKYVRVHVGPRRVRRWIKSCNAQGSIKHVVRIGHGRRVTVAGWFATTDGTPLSHVPVRIMMIPDGGWRTWRTARTVTTSDDGGWRVTLPAGPSRLIKAVYAGGPTTQPAESPGVRVRVPALSTLTLVHRVIYISAFGVYGRFEGRLLGGFVPPRGATVAVQALDRGIWRVIATVTSDGQGRWRAHYKVTGGPGAYPLRVYIPRQGGYPWESAYSGHATLTIRP